MSFRLRLTLWYTALLAGTLVVFSILLYVSLSAVTAKQYEEMLRKNAENVYERIRVDYGLFLRGWNIDLELDAVDLYLSKEIYLQVVNFTNPNNRIRSLNAVQNDIVLPLNVEQLSQIADRKAFFAKAEIQNLPFLIYYRPLIYQGQVIGILQAAMNTGDFLAELKWILLALSFTSLLIAFTLGRLMAKKALKPIDHVIETTELIEKEGDLNHRIAYRGPKDEIGRLIQKINDMLEKIQTSYNELEESYRNQRRLVSDASHELRTPLTTIRGNVELLKRAFQPFLKRDLLNETERELFEEGLNDIAAEAERMSRLVEDMLSLARADAGYQMERVPLLLQPIVEEVARKAQMLPRRAEFIIGDFSELAGIYVLGNRDYLQQLLFILLENAFKYTEQGQVMIEAMTEKNMAGIRVSDTGAGMDEDEVPHIFERFYRADLSRGKKPGTGLGLAIAKWIIDEHDGSIEVFTKKGKGTSFLLWLPQMDKRDLAQHEQLKLD